MKIFEIRTLVRANMSVVNGTISTGVRRRGVSTQRVNNLFQIILIVNWILLWV